MSRRVYRNPPKRNRIPVNEIDTKNYLNTQIHLMGPESSSGMTHTPVSSYQNLPVVDGDDAKKLEEKRAIEMLSQVENKIKVEPTVINVSSYERQTTGPNEVAISWALSPIISNNTVEYISKVIIQPFNFPNLDMGRQGISPATKPSYLYNQKVFLSITPFNSIQQRVNTHNGSGFHIECEVDPINTNAQAIRLRPLNDVIFRVPFQSIDIFRVEFYRAVYGATLNQIRLPPDRVFVRLHAGSNPARFTILSDYTTYKTLYFQNGVIPDAYRVAVKVNIATNDPGFNNASNDELGYFVTEIIDDTTFDIADLDAAGVLLDTEAEMFIPRNEIRMTVSMLSVNNVANNGVIITDAKL